MFFFLSLSKHFINPRLFYFLGLQRRSSKYFELFREALRKNGFEGLESKITKEREEWKRNEGKVNEAEVVFYKELQGGICFIFYARQTDSRGCRNYRFIINDKVKSKSIFHRQKEVTVT